MASRTRNFATVVYPESAPDGWQQLLADELVPAFISPLHCSDLNADGEPKKPHYHVVIMFDSVKTDDQAKVIFDKIGGVGCLRVVSMRGQARYLCHLDNPEKAQYSPDDVIALCGADYLGTISLVTDKYQAIKDMIQFCEDNNVHAYSDLLVWCMENKMEWFRVLCDSATYVLKEYLKSKTWSNNNVN